MSQDLTNPWSNYSRCLISNDYDYFSLRYTHIPICATCVTNGTWQRHLCHFMDIG